MNQNEKRWIVLLVAVVIIAIVFFVVLGFRNKDGEDLADNSQNVPTNEEQYTVQLDDGTKLNTSEDFNSNKTYGDLEISNIQYTTRPDGMTVLLADVTNKGTTNHELEMVKITILDQNGEAITEIRPLIDAMAPGETVQINASITADVSNAKDFTIEAAEYWCKLYI